MKERGQKSPEKGEKQEIKGKCQQANKRAGKRMHALARQAGKQRSLEKRAFWKDTVLFMTVKGANIMLLLFF